MCSVRTKIWMGEGGANCGRLPFGVDLPNLSSDADAVKQ